MPVAARTSARCCRVLPEELTRDGLVAVGYSLGGAMLLKYLGEEGAASPLARGRQRLGADRPCRHLPRT